MGYLFTCSKQVDEPAPSYICHGPAASFVDGQLARENTIRAPGPLLASGRDSEIFDYGPGLVLRRSRRGRSMEREAKIMAYVAQFGYPAPRVEEVSAEGSQLVMERIDASNRLEGHS